MLIKCKIINEKTNDQTWKIYDSDYDSKTRVIAIIFWADLYQCESLTSSFKVDSAENLNTNFLFGII